MPDQLRPLWKGEITHNDETLVFYTRALFEKTAKVQIIHQLADKLQIDYYKAANIWYESDTTLTEQK